MDDQETAAQNEEHQTIVAASFPSISCLRCGFSNFFLMPNVKGPGGVGVVTLACERCGHIEQHLIGVLRDAIKKQSVPIPLKAEDDAAV